MEVKKNEILDETNKYNTYPFCGNDEDVRDPEEISALLTIASTLGKILAIIIPMTTTIIVLRREKKSKLENFKKDEERINTINKAIKNVIIDLNFSTMNLERILNKFRKYNDEIGKNILKFGEGNLYLNNNLRKEFIRVEKDIHKSAKNICNDLNYLIDLLTERGDVKFKNFCNNIEMKNIVKSYLKPINLLISNFGKITIEQFIDDSINICEDVYEIIKKLEERLFVEPETLSLV